MRKLLPFILLILLLVSCNELKNYEKLVKENQIILLKKGSGLYYKIGDADYVTTSNVDYSPFFRNLKNSKYDLSYSDNMFLFDSSDTYKSLYEFVRLEEITHQSVNISIIDKDSADSLTILKTYFNYDEQILIKPVIQIRKDSVFLYCDDAVYSSSVSHIGRKGIQNEINKRVAQENSIFKKIASSNFSYKDHFMVKIAVDSSIKLSKVNDVIKRFQLPANTFLEFTSVDDVTPISIHEYHAQKAVDLLTLNQLMSSSKQPSKKLYISQNIAFGKLFKNLNYDSYQLINGYERKEVLNINDIAFSPVYPKVIIDDTSVTYKYFDMTDEVMHEKRLKRFPKVSFESCYRKERSYKDKNELQNLVVIADSSQKLSRVLNVLRDVNKVRKNRTLLFKSREFDVDPVNILSNGLKRRKGDVVVSSVSNDTIYKQKEYGEVRKIPLWKYLISKDNFDSVTIIQYQKEINYKSFIEVFNADKRNYINDTYVKSYQCNSNKLLHYPLFTFKSNGEIEIRFQNRKVSLNINEFTHFYSSKRGKSFFKPKNKQMEKIVLENPFDEIFITADDSVPISSIEDFINQSSSKYFAYYFIKNDTKIASAHKILRLKLKEEKEKAKKERVKKEREKLIKKQMVKEEIRIRKQFASCWRDSKKIKPTYPHYDYNKMKIVKGKGNLDYYAYTALKEDIKQTIHFKRKVRVNIGLFHKEHTHLEIIRVFDENRHRLREAYFDSYNWSGIVPLVLKFNKGGSFYA